MTKLELLRLMESVCDKVGHNTELVRQNMVDNFGNNSNTELLFAFTEILELTSESLSEMASYYEEG